MDEAALFMTRQSARCASDRSADAWARVVVGSLRILMATLCALLRGERRLTRRKQSIFFLGQLYGMESFRGRSAQRCVRVMFLTI